MDTNAIDRITADVLRAKDLPSAVRLLTSDLIAAREAATTSHEQIALAEQQRDALVAAVKRLYVAAEAKATTPEGIANEEKAHGAALVDLFRLAGLC